MIKGFGSKLAKVVLVGEAPSSQETLIGQPFVGPSGLILNQALEALNLNRSALFLTNLIKVQLPSNRKPTALEIAEWGPLLMEELSEFNPKLIVTLGSVASQYMLDTDLTIGKLAGNVYKSGLPGVKVLPVWHPRWIARHRELQTTWTQHLGIIKDYL